MLLSQLLFKLILRWQRRGRNGDIITIRDSKRLTGISNSRVMLWDAISKQLVCTRIQKLGKFSLEFSGLSVWTMNMVQYLKRGRLSKEKFLSGIGLHLSPNC